MYIEDTSLSRAWARAFLEVYKPGIDRIVPLVVVVTGLNGSQVGEDLQIRHALDETLRQNALFDCQTVANTLFPQSLWNPLLGRKALFDRYLKILPQIKKAARSNQYGLYFERLIAYGQEHTNQLDHIITTYHRLNRRPTALQASVFIPSFDHRHQPRRGFPCMQHIAFAPVNDGELAVTGFYASQLVFQKAYGNYLGLCRLGHFMAHELGLRFTQMTCCASTALRGNTPKRDVQDLLEKLAGMETMAGHRAHAGAQPAEVNYVGTR